MVPPLSAAARFIAPLHEGHGGRCPVIVIDCPGPNGVWLTARASVWLARVFFGHANRVRTIFILLVDLAAFRKMNILLTPLLQLLVNASRCVGGLHDREFVTYDRGEVG
jgi:hypothetical protein